MKSRRTQVAVSTTPLKPILVFIAKFTVLMALYYPVSLTRFFDRALYVYLCANARITSGLLNLLGQHCHSTGLKIDSQHFIIVVQRGCDAVEPSWLLASAILAFPSASGSRIKGIIIGIILLQLLNLLRIVSLYFTGIHLPRFFNTLHVEIWPMVFITCAMLFWFGWTSTLKKTHV